MVQLVQHKQNSKHLPCKKCKNGDVQKESAQGGCYLQMKGTNLEEMRIWRREGGEVIGRNENGQPLASGEEESWSLNRVGAATQL